ncbi:MAG: hypothetical protein RIA69_20225 [Cyclobacteriaceae bacterium]
MPQIKLLTIQCTTPDEIDKDETYLKFNDEKIWPAETRYHRLDTGDKVDLNITLEAPEGWNTIELWDFDYMSFNDHLGDFKFKVDSQSGQYSTSMELVEKGSTASYILLWEIL